MGERTQQKLSSDRVRAVMTECLFEDSEIVDGKPPADAVLVSGIVSSYAFHPGRVEESRAAIAEMLGELPDEFMATGGGGMSFLNACMDRHGNHWAEHPTMGALFALGEAAGLAKPIFPREMWSILPGGMPYFVVTVPAAPVEASPHV